MSQRKAKGPAEPMDVDPDEVHRMAQVIAAALDEDADVSEALKEDANNDEVFVALHVVAVLFANHAGYSGDEVVKLRTLAVFYARQANEAAAKAERRETHGSLS